MKGVLDSLHKFALSLLVLQPEPKGYGSRDDTPSWTCPVQCYLAAQGIREDGNFKPPEVLTQLLAKLKYFCRNCALIQADRTKHTKGGMIT